MANPEHVEILKQGVAAWNARRLENLDVRPNFRDAALGWEYLAPDATGPFVFVADLHEADFTAADLLGTVLDGADLSGANLSSADLTETRLRGARLHGADLTYTNLTGADLSGADLGGADLGGASLHGCQFSGSRLAGANLSNAALCGAAFRGVDLSAARGLESVRHEGPSSIDLETLCESQGRIPEDFLRGCGVAEHGVTYARSLAGYARTSACYIRYASCDSAFAQRLHGDLQAAGVRCWYAPEGTKIGQSSWQRTGPALRPHFRLVLVLSQEALQRRWLIEEVAGLIAEERRRGYEIILPLGLHVNPAALTGEFAGRAGVDFRGGGDPERYREALEQLLRHLKAEETTSSVAQV